MTIEEVSKIRFESSVNSEGIETVNVSSEYGILFESSVNSEGIETINLFKCRDSGLRAV